MVRNGDSCVTKGRREDRRCFGVVSDVDKIDQTELSKGKVKIKAAVVPFAEPESDWRKTTGVQWERTREEAPI